MLGCIFVTMKMFKKERGERCMYIHDISKDTLTTEVYPGDPETVVTSLRSMDEDEVCSCRNAY